MLAAEACLAWHQATEPAQKRALAADTELRRRHSGIDLPRLHPEPVHVARTRARAAGPEPGSAGSPATRGDEARIDIGTAMRAGTRARDIIAARQAQARQDIGTEDNDLMRWREAEALREARAWRTAVRQPLNSGRAGRQVQPDLEPEVGG